MQMLLKQELSNNFSALMSTMDTFQFGISEIASNFDDRKYQEFWLRNSQHIRIFQTYIPKLEDYVDDLLLALKRGARVEFLLLNPNSKYDFVGMRTQAIGREDINGRAILVQNLLTIQRLASIASKERDIKGTVELRLYEYLPACAVYQCDSTFLVHIMFQNERAIYGPQFIVRDETTPIGKRVKREIDTFWNKAEIVPDLANIEKYLHP